MVYPCSGYVLPLFRAPEEFYKKFKMNEMWNSFFYVYFSFGHLLAIVRITVDQEGFELKSAKE